MQILLDEIPNSNIGTIIVHYKSYNWVIIYKCGWRSYFDFVINPSPYRVHLDNSREDNLNKGNHHQAAALQVATRLYAISISMHLCA